MALTPAEFRELKFEKINQLDIDHPGANDKEYRARRDYIASCSKKFRETGVITDVDYNAREQRVWRYVAEELEELQQKFASYNNVGLLIPETTGQLDFPRLNSLLRAVGPPKVPT